MDRTVWITRKKDLWSIASSMPRSQTITQNLIHYAFISICIAGFFLSCFGFLIYRLFLKPLAFGLILLMTLPMVGRELMKKDQPVHSTHIDSNSNSNIND